MYGVLAGIIKMNLKYEKILTLAILNGDSAACPGILPSNNFIQCILQLN
jgi:hypothetical protein